MPDVPGPLPKALSRAADPALQPCAACEVRELGLCAVLEANELIETAAIARISVIAPQQPVFFEHDDADVLFNVTKGTVKLFKLLPDGRRQITGFLGRGDFLGLAVNDVYSYSAEAVDEVHLCGFPRKKLEALLKRYPKLEHRLFEIASDELAAAQEQMLLLGRKTARERLASFLVNLLRAQERRNEPGEQIFLPMSRADIADYLGLTTETVSRTFSQFKRDQFIRLREGARVEIADRARLEDIAEGA